MPISLDTQASDLGFCHHDFEVSRHISSLLDTPEAPFCPRVEPRTDRPRCRELKWLALRW